ncbi:MAG: sigma-70 family RNA polymerase sigma factor [Fuerstiella sp.]|jgi:RNA polymerase sigma-70 factor (ECF subfamily)|nr:sigma-70 family RNA polymerase sigma factor [Fuerstiella sp.]MDG2130261.1 sigma-70 family RNA polymerase sigma factor [Fuerstiella sp.]
MFDPADNIDRARVSSETSSSGVPGELFIREFTQSQRRLYLYILPLVGNSSDADEILQETNLVIWAKWRQFELGSNFLAWGRAIARLEVFRHRRNRNRKMTLLDGNVLEQVAEQSELVNEHLDVRQAALAKCLTQLRVKDRELIELRYAPGANGDKVAKTLGRPANSVYQSLGRIRRVLMECVRMQLAEEGRLT